MPTSQAKVPTDAAPRYAKQLLSHLGRKRQVEALEGEPDGGRLVFENGTGTVRPAGDHLLLVAAPAASSSSPGPTTPDAYPRELRTGPVEARTRSSVGRTRVSGRLSRSRPT